MLMLENATPVAVRELAKIACPAPTDTWRPYPHSEVVAALSDRMEDRGLTVRKSRLTLVDGAMYPVKGIRVDVKGARLFGSFDLEPSGDAFPPGCVPSLGLVNSIDKSRALTILIGMRVMACSNGVLYVERGVQVSRKHTSGLELESAFDNALDAYEEAVPGMADLYERLRGQRVSMNKAKALTVDLASAGAIPSAHILSCVREFSKPRHDVFRSHDAWSLYNAVTEASFKRMSPQRAATSRRWLPGTQRGAGRCELIVRDYSLDRQHGRPPTWAVGLERFSIAIGSVSVWDGGGERALHEPDRGAEEPMRDAMGYGERASRSWA